MFHSSYRKYLEILSSLSLFAGISKLTLTKILSKMQERSYQKGEMILKQGEFGDTLFTITKGRVKVARSRPDGSEVIFAILDTGEVFGEISLIDMDPRLANVITLKDTDVLTLKRSDLLKFLKEYPSISMSLHIALAKRIRKNYELIENLSLSKAEDRVGRTLLKLVEEHGTMSKGSVQVDIIPITKDIARMAGTTRETVSRIMNSFSNNGLIKREKRKLHILDYTQFKRTFN